MKRSMAAAAAFAAIAVLACGAAPAQTILFTFTGLPGGAADSCKWFDDDLNNDRSVRALTRQTDLLYNRVALPVDTLVAVGGTATTQEGEALVDFKLGSRTICTAAEAIYGPTPEPSVSR